MHVLLLGKIPPIQGGVSRMTWLASNDIAESGHTVTILSNGAIMERGFRQMMTSADQDKLSEHLEKNPRCRMIEAIEPLAYIPWAPPYVSQLVGLGLNECDIQMPDAIIGWYFEPYGVAASILGEMHSKPVILRHAGSDLGRLKEYSDLRPFYDRTLSRAERIITSVGSKVAQRLIDAGADSDRIVQARGRALDPQFSDRDVLDYEMLVAESEAWFADYGFEPELFRTLINWNREGLQAADPVIGTYGKIAEVKGTYQLIDALDQLVEDGVPLVYRALWSASPRRFAHAFRHLTSKPNLKGRTVILPPLPPWQVPAFIRSCSAVAFLENKFPIDFHGPQIPREVLASGRALVVSGEIYEKLFFQDQLVSGVNVMRVDDPDNVQQLAEVIRTVIVDLELRNSLAHHGKTLSRAVEANALPRDQIVDVLEGLATA